jgi:hypothetical protein
MDRYRRLQMFWRQIPTPAFAVFVLAVGVTFASSGFLGDLDALDRQTFSAALYGAALSGLVAMAFTCVVIDLRWIAVAVALLAAGGWFVAGPANAPPFAGFAGLTQAERLHYDRVGALLAVAFGYNGFLYFILVQGQRWVTVRSEMRLAQQMHRTLVPVVQRRIGCVECYGASWPSGQVGGDLVDAIDLPGDEWLAYVADVTGHGVSSGLFMGMVKSAVRMAVVARPALPELVGELNRVMCAELQPNMFVTFAGLCGRADGTVEVVIAGHPPLLRVRPGATVVEEVAAENVPVGLQPGWRFTASSLQLERGDLLAIVTDGLFEVFDRADRDFGLSGIKAVLTASYALPLAEIASLVAARARAFGPQLDDQTILLVRG